MIVRIKTPRYLLNCNDQIKTKARLITIKSFCYCSYYCTSSRVYKKEGDTNRHKYGERERGSCHFYHRSRLPSFFFCNENNMNHNIFFLIDTAFKEDFLKKKL